MNVTSTDQKVFDLIDNEQSLGKLIYPSPFALNAEIMLSATETYKLAPVGFFGTSIALTQNDHTIANLSLNWNGNIIIVFQDGREYALKLAGTFQSCMILVNKHQEKIMHFEPKFNWKDFYYQYNITYDTAKKAESKDIVLLLVAVYAANYFIATISGANAGLM